MSLEEDTSAGMEPKVKNAPTAGVRVEQNQVGI